MKISHEEVHYQNPFLCLKIWEIVHDSGGEMTPQPADTPPDRWHYHREAEFLLILQGEMEVGVPEEKWTIGSGDVLLIGSSQPHWTRPLGKPLKYIVFQLDLASHFDQSVVVHLKYFQEQIRPLSALNYIFKENPEAKKKVAEAILGIYEEIGGQAKGYEIAISMLVKQIILVLVRSDRSDRLQYDRGEQLQMLAPVLLYIDKNLKEKVTVAEASRRMNLSYHHFLRTFKRAIGMSFTEYVNFKRIRKAEQLLLTEDLTVEQIANEVGIPNRAHFHELFKRQHGCSPAQFKRRMHKQFPTGESRKISGPEEAAAGTDG
ncbi:helix-turn-helix domain-containing protein [Paenibacillus residui]|uniref:Helix-turn-helix domain-containing protein n=1 Tax=Paenibacillus residui TaxID=629724 RepID=A0ABW3D555_9BACL